MTAYWMSAGTDDEGNERPPVWIPEVGPAPKGGAL